LKALSELLGDFRERSGIDLYHLRRNASQQWAETVGDRIASYSCVIGFVHGELRVAAYHPAAGMEIRSRERNILRALNGAAGRKVFDRIIVVRRPAGSAGGPNT
jgi:hypothetical protein